jgi:hypothetical protein
MSPRKLLLFAVLLWALSACGLGQNPARATLQASVTPPATPTEPSPPTATREPPPTNPAVPTATIAPTDEAEVTATPDPAATTATPTTGAPVATAVAGANVAEFVADVTVPDGTNFTPGETFVKTWRLKNVGTSPWSTGYLFVYAKGEQMAGPQTQPLPNSVAPGETVDISLDLTAPDRLGAHTGFWQLRTDAGQPFGIGAGANEPVYVQINVAVGANASPGPTGAPAGNIQVTSVTMTGDVTSGTGSCPQVFTFNLALTSQGAGTVTYLLEASSSTPGFTFNLPAAAQSVFTGPGPRTFNGSYTLEFSGTVSGQVWVHVLSPNDMESNKVSFTLTCAPTAAPPTAVPPTATGSP